MAKTAKLKNSHKPSIHSRASKRQPSPNPLDKSTLPRSTIEENASFLAPHTNAGITKSKVKSKPLKRKQRLRIEQGKEKAENIAEKIQVKVQGSERRTSGKRGRRAKWEELNETIGKEVSKPLKRDRRKPHDIVVPENESAWEDEHENGAMEGIDSEEQDDRPAEDIAKDHDETAVATEVDSTSLAIEDEVL